MLCNCAFSYTIFLVILVGNNYYGMPPDPVEIGIGRDNSAAYEAEIKFKILGAQKEKCVETFSMI